MHPIPIHPSDPLAEASVTLRSPSNAVWEAGVLQIYECVRPSHSRGRRTHFESAPDDGNRRTETCLTVVWQPSTTIICFCCNSGRTLHYGSCRCTPERRLRGKVGGSLAICGYLGAQSYTEIWGQRRILCLSCAVGRRPHALQVLGLRVLKTRDDRV